MNIKQIHREAMVFAQEAHLLQQNGDFEKSIELFEKAFELEQQAALFYLNHDKEPGTNCRQPRAGSGSKNVRKRPQGRQLQRCRNGVVLRFE